MQRDLEGGGKSIMADTEPLFALLELMLRTFTKDVPKMQAGGHPEDIFLDLSDEERDEIECSICYQILKDVRQCGNKHKFCYSCIFVWSTSGNPVNHSRCPVCRGEGLYVKNHSLDEKINSKTVKCSLKSCRWNGELKFLPSHQHDTYSDSTSSSQPSETADVKPTQLPTVENTVASRPTSNSRSRSGANNTQSSLVSSPQTPSSRTYSQRHPLGTSSLNNNNITQSSGRNASSNQRTNGQRTNRSRTRSRHRQNSSSPQRRSNITATGLNSRLTSRARIQNNGRIESRATNSQTTNINQSRPETNENQNPTTELTTTEPILLPHPPTTPRPTTQTPRRLPTLTPLIPLNSLDNRTTETQNLQTDRNNNISTPVTSSPADNGEIPRRFTIEATIRRPSQVRSFGLIRERLNESRQRLDMLMTVFSAELDRGRQDLTSFQQERERRRQEQLAEVRDLGRRLTHVAQELRGLLNQRRQIRTQMDHLLDPGTDE